MEFAVLLGMDARPYTFSYAELRNATEDFSPNKLGEGGFGPVYKVGHYPFEQIFFYDYDYDYKHGIFLNIFVFYCFLFFCNNFIFVRGHFDGGFVAVKQLSVSSHQGKNQFVTEIATISAVQHRNLVKLYGCCIEGVNRSLVYEYLKNKSLDKALFGKS